MGNETENHPMRQTAGYIRLAQLLLPCTPCHDGLIPLKFRAKLNSFSIHHLGPGVFFTATGSNKCSASWDTYNSMYPGLLNTITSQSLQIGSVPIVPQSTQNGI